MLSINSAHLPARKQLAARASFGTSLSIFDIILLRFVIDLLNVADLVSSVDVFDISFPYISSAYEVNSSLEHLVPF